MTAVDWAEAATSADADFMGLARLERESLAAHPEVLDRIDEAVEEFRPRFIAAESESGGKALLARVTASLAVSEKRVEGAPAAVGLFGGFLVVLLPAILLAMMIRGAWPVDDFIGWTSVLQLSAAALVLVIAAVWWRQPSSLGMRIGWSSGAALVSLLAVAAAGLRVNIDFDHGGEFGQTWVMLDGLAAGIITFYAVLNAVRSVRYSRALIRGVGAEKPAADAFASRYSTLYGLAAARIEKIVSALPQNQYNLAKDDRDAAFDLWRDRGLITGQLPPVIRDKPLGELILFSVSEPIVSDGGYPLPRGAAIR